MLILMQKGRVLYKSLNRSDRVVSADDVTMLYICFLGRHPESESVVFDKVGQTFDRALSGFLGSAEFEENVFLPITVRQNPRIGLFSGQPTNNIKDWLLANFSGNISAAVELANAERWVEVQHWLFADKSVKQCLPETLIAQYPDFISGMDRLLSHGAVIVGSIDTLNGRYIDGWVFDADRPDTAATVEFVVDDKVIMSVQASRMREDVRRAGFGSGLAAFHAQLPIDLSDGQSVMIHARLKGTNFYLQNSPKRADFPVALQRWLGRKERVTGQFAERLRARLDRLIAPQTLSIVMPVFNTPEDWLREAIESVISQWCSRWELICVDDCSPQSHVATVLAEYAARDLRIKVVYRETNGGIALSTNNGIAEAKGDYIAFMDHDDVLEPDAVYHLLRGAKVGADLIYSDELLVGEKSNDLMDLQIRPAFSWDYYLSHPYFVHMVAVRADIVDTIGGLDESMHISADVDFVLRAIEQSHTIAHVPVVIYRWRTHMTSAGHAQRERVTEATVAALNRHLMRTAPGAVAQATSMFNQHHIEFPDDGGMVLAIIPTKNRGDLVRTCIESFRRTTRPDQLHICVVDHDSDDPETIEYLRSIKGSCTILPYSGPFNYPAINNFAVGEMERRLRRLPPYLLFSNNDIEARDSGWLERMRTLARRRDVGIVGATLLYPDYTIQHSGVVMGLNLAADHAHKFAPFYGQSGDRDRGHLCSLVSTRDYSAVTAACMMMRSEVFRSVNGFDEQFVVGFNDTDLCLRVGETGLKIINDGESVLYHHESATRSQTKQIEHVEDDALLQKRWAKIIREGDPFYSPLFEQFGISHQFARYTSLRQPIRIRPGLAKPIPNLRKLGRWNWLRRFIGA